MTNRFDPAPASDTVLSVRDVSKSFPGVRALHKVNLDVRRGEVHCLVGENGAGKSTLMKILSGAYTKDEGVLIFKGQPVTFTSPRDAQIAGIATIYQELNLIPYLSVTENIFLGAEIVRPGTPLLDWPMMHRETHAGLARLHLTIDPRTPIAKAGIAVQQMIEVAKALHHRADLLIMDEPTSALSRNEIADLYQIIRDLKAQGVSIIFISHHLDEVFQIGDRVTVLRDGCNIETLAVADTNVEALIRLMVGRDLADQFPKVPVEAGAEVLRVDGLTRRGVLDSISFQVRRGEIVGLAGLVGAGRTELVRALFGADPIDAGRICIDGQPVLIQSPADAIRCGLGLLTEDRKQQGLILGMSVRENTTLPILGRLAKIFTNPRRESELTQNYIRDLAIKTPNDAQKVINLSGGTQQKVVLSKWLATAPRMLIFDEPTRGIDVGAKVEIYRLMNQLAAQGVGILMVSSELPEILGMSDRVLVMAQGRLTGELSRAEATQEKILEYATLNIQSTLANPSPQAREKAIV